MRKKQRPWNKIYPTEKHPVEVWHFKRMQRRVHRTKKYSTTSWSRDITGFYDFLKCLGLCPTSMIKPSLGRIDHDKGYEPGNVFWQEWRENHLDGCRKGGHVAGSQGRSIEARHKMSITALERRENRSRAGKIGGRKSTQRKNIKRDHMGRVIG